MANTDTTTDTTITIMAFEGGALIDALSDKPQGAALASKIEEADQAALNDGKVQFDISFNPIEVGMAFNAVSKNDSTLSQALSGKLRDALKAKLDELGISYGGTAPQQPELGGEELPEGQEDPAEAGEETLGDEDAQDSL